MKKLLIIILILLGIALPVLADNEDFTTYTELDPGADITVAASKLTFVDLDSRNTDSWVYKDMGVDYYSGDFEHLMEGETGSGSTDDDCFGIYWAMSNSVDDILGIDNASGDVLYTFFHPNAAGNGPNYVYLREVDGGTSYSTVIVSLSEDTTYYLKVKRDEAVGTYGTIYVYVYSDSARTNLVDSVSLTLNTSKKDYRYIYGTNTYNDGTTGSQYDGFVQNFDIGETYATAVEPAAIINFD